MSEAAAAAVDVPPRGNGSRYRKIKHLGEGQFGMVYSAEDLGDGKTYAVKKIKVGRKEDAVEGLHPTAVREIKLMQELDHVNILKLVDVFAKKANVSLVIELCSTDLEVLLRDKSVQLVPADVKSFLLMSFQGLEYLHNNWILHRDLKPSNLLLTDGGIVKIADFGCATQFGSPTRSYTPVIVTLWYRAPELLFGCRKYGTAVDIWSMGCIQAELELTTALLPGQGDLDQLSKIFELMGTHTDKEWPGMSSLPLAKDLTFPDRPGTPLRDVLIAAPDDAIGLLENLLVCDPRKRFTCAKALQHPYFSNAPAPTAPERLPKAGAASGAAVQPTMQRDPAANAVAIKRKKMMEMEEDGGPLKRVLFG